MLSLVSMQKKSRKCGPTGCWRRNLYSEKRLSRSHDHINRSPQVSHSRNLRARRVVWGCCFSMMAYEDFTTLPHPSPLPLGEGGTHAVSLKKLAAGFAQPQTMFG